MKTTIYYSVQNCGDGSAYPKFFYDKICADVHQEAQIEGWGEDCTGVLEIEHNSPTSITIGECITYKEYLAELEADLASYNGCTESWAKESVARLTEAIRKLKE